MPTDPEWRQNRIDRMNPKETHFIVKFKTPKRFISIHFICFFFQLSITYWLCSVFPAMPLLHAQNIPLIPTVMTISVIICNGNSTEWSPIRSVIILVITKIAQRESDLFITSLITDRIGQHEVLLPLNHKNYNFRENCFDVD